MNTVPGAFPREEYAARMTRAQAAMAQAGLAAVMVTGDAEFRYFAGFHTEFWESPTRPWFLVLPAQGGPVAVIPAIGQALMARTWVEDIRCWSAPDPVDDGVTLLADTLTELAGAGGRIGVPMGAETNLRMPLSDWHRLQQVAASLEFASDGGLVSRLRSIKSEAEIARIGAACATAGRAFDRLGDKVGRGMPLDAVFRKFRMLCLDEGADKIPYLAGAAGQGGYMDVISPAGPIPLRDGDVLMLDTGLMRDGYFCDFDRNFSVGAPSPGVATGHARLVEATQAGFEAARPGATASELFTVMDAVLTGRTSGERPGRLGHGLGLQLTEGLSLIPSDMTVLVPGMVITLEPVVPMDDGRIMVHEENIVIREQGAGYLSPPAGPEIRVAGM